MYGIADAITKAGGFLRRRDLIAAGFSDARIRQALRAKEIFRVRQGWFSLPTTTDVAVTAVRIGGRVTGLAALTQHGLWIPKHSIVDIAVPADARGLRRPRDMRSRLAVNDKREFAIHWIESTSHRRSSPWLATVPEALAFVLSHCDREMAIVCFDSALHKGKVTIRGVKQIFAEAPLRVRRWESDVDGRAQSGGESIARLRCRDAGIPFEPQAEVPGVGHLDGRIGVRTYLEIDGEEGHANPAGMHEDRRRDAAVALWGGRVLRFDYPQLYFDWSLCLDVMREALAWEAALDGRTGPLRRRASELR